jgi:hypothetical protein
MSESPQAPHLMLLPRNECGVMSFAAGAPQTGHSIWNSIEFDGRIVIACHF